MFLPAFVELIFTALCLTTATFPSVSILTGTSLRRDPFVAGRVRVLSFIDVKVVTAITNGITARQSPEV